MTDPAGRLLWISPTMPGRAHDLTAARAHRIRQTISRALATARAPVERGVARLAEHCARLWGILGRLAGWPVDLFQGLALKAGGTCGTRWSCRRPDMTALSRFRNEGKHHAG
ncbi:hypothetical protein RKD49_006080 [Streptomyces glaucescens]